MLLVKNITPFLKKLNFNYYLTQKSLIEYYIIESL